MPKKFVSCVRKVNLKNKKENGKYNPYAICRVSTKYFGSTKHKNRRSL